MSTATNPVAPLGGQGLRVARLGYGCMSLSAIFYGPTGLTDEECGAILKKAYDLGVRLFNTSDLYGPYDNEKLLGKYLDSVKKDITIATKWGPMIVPGKGIVADFGRENCRACCEGQLQRLGVPAIQLWTMRGPTTPQFKIEETMQEVKALVAEGKVLYVGLSEVSADEIRRAHAITPITAVELEWSLFTRDAENDLVPVCRELGIGIMAYSPLGRGLLTGKMTSMEQLDASDFRRHSPQWKELEKNLVLVKRVEALAQTKGCTPGQLALAWLLHKGDDIFPIPGTKRIPFLEENMGALNVKLTPQEMSELEAAVPQDEIVGTRYPDMQHTYHGSGKAHA